MIVAFTGRKGSGKDTAAAVFVAAGFAHVKFADCLKSMLATLMIMQGASDKTVNRSIEGDLKEVPSIFLGGRTPRYAMQHLGTAWGRDLIGEDFWVNSFKNAASHHTNVVVSDMRFPNEAQAIADMGGWRYRIVRPEVMNSNDNHPSELLIDQLQVDGEILNTAKSIGEFQDQIVLLLSQPSAKIQ